MKYLALILFSITFLLLDDEIKEKETLENLKKQLKHHEQQAEIIKKKIAAIEKPPKASIFRRTVTTEIKGIDSQLETINQELSDKLEDFTNAKTKFFSVWKKAQKNYKVFKKQYPLELKILKKELSAKKKDWGDNPVLKTRAELDYSEDKEALDQKLEEYKKAANKSPYLKIWERSSRSDYKDIENLKKIKSDLKARKIDIYNKQKKAWEVAQKKPEKK